MANNRLGDIRRSAVISTFGPGAIVDFRSDGAAISAVASGLEVWDERTQSPGLAHPQTIFEPRLQKRLGVSGFRLPPVVPDTSKLPDTLVGVRFPEWLQCPGCHHIRPATKWSQKPGKVSRFCGTCTAAKPAGQRSGNEVFAVPVRFVTACESGHLDEFPWNVWVGHSENCSNRDDLVLLSRSAGLAGLFLQCPRCGSERSMDGIFKEKALAFLPCRGHRPWLRLPDQQCGKAVRTLQRGSSNLYFPVIHSALDIPPWTDALQKALGQYWAPILGVLPEQRSQFIEMLKNTVLAHIKMPSDQIAASIGTREQLLNRPESKNLRLDEYLQFTSDTATPLDERKEFEIRQERIPEPLQKCLDRLVRVVRLREVRAISGFTRINPPASEDENNRNLIAPISETRLSWLPAIEVRGEGIFISFRADQIERWARNGTIRQRASKLEEKYRQQWEERNGNDGSPPRTISAKFILLHTFAHVLMKQISLDCGYSSASLRERIYIDDDAAQMSGVLVYTATTDSDGTLGGLSRQGISDRIAASVPAAIQAVQWCSSDPICIEGLTSLSQGTNGAACHACVLAPETSCEEFNCFLDRAFLVGLPGQPEAGYFSGLVERGA